MLNNQKFFIKDQAIKKIFCRKVIKKHLRKYLIFVLFNPKRFFI